MPKFKKGHRGYWLGKKKPHSEEAKRNISEGLRGHVASDKVRRILKSYAVGHTPWNKGKGWPKEIKDKIRMTNKQKGIEPKIKFKPRKGDKNPRWNGGTWGYWKRQALTRDDYTCQICGHREPEIMEVDHTKSKAKFPELEKDLDNLLTLCPNCHRRKTNRELRTR